MILLLGASGYLANAFAKALESKGAPFRAISRSEVDYYDREKLLTLIREVRPGFIINAAGYPGFPNVSETDKNPLNLIEANASLPALLADVCASEKITLGHISTGCIYSGNKPDGSGFSESDPPNFTHHQGTCSLYSATKALAEEILSPYNNVYLWRLRRPFNHIDHPKNYLSKFLTFRKLLETENSISQMDEFVRACLACFEESLPTGIYNLTNPGIIQTSEIAKAALKHKIAQQPFAFFESMEEFNATAGSTPRSECILDSSKIQSYNIPFTEIHEAIDRAFRDWVPSRRGLPG